MTARPGCTDERWDLASPETASISKVARPTIYPVQRSFMEGMEQISNGKKGTGVRQVLGNSTEALLESWTLSTF